MWTASLVGFIAGFVDILSFGKSWGWLVLTVISIIIVLLQLRRFFKKVIHFLKPGLYPKWKDVGELVHIYLTMLAAFTLINVSMSIVHYFFPDRTAAFISSGDLNNLIDSFYFSVVMMTTVGFGDIHPNTPVARLIVAFQCMISYVMFGLMIGNYYKGNISGARR